MTQTPTDLRTSLTNLTNIMVDSGRIPMRKDPSLSKPEWVAKAEKFESLVSKLDDEQKSKNFSSKFISKSYKANKENFTLEILRDEKVCSKFIKDITFGTNDGEHLSKLKLPVGDAYSASIQLAMSDDSYNRLPLEITCSLFYVIYHACLCGSTSEEEIDLLKKNISMLTLYIKALEDENDDSDASPLEKIKKMLSGCTPGDMTKMLGEITADLKNNSEYGEAFTDVMEGVKNNKDPKEIFSNLFEKTKEPKSGDKNYRGDEKADSVAKEEPVKEETSEIQKGTETPSENLVVVEKEAPTPIPTPSEE
jgi:hypothetical protein